MIFDEMMKGIGYLWLCAVPLLYFGAFFERKLAADLEARIGPERVGWSGFFQGFADLSKYLSHMGARLSTRQWMTVWFSGFLLLLATRFLLEVGSVSTSAQRAATPICPIWIIWILLVIANLQLLVGMGLLKSFPHWLTLVRSVAQVMGGVLVALFGLLQISYRAESFDLEKIIALQLPHVLRWNALSDPLGFIGFFVFIISGMILTMISPFDQQKKSILGAGSLVSDADQSWSWIRGYGFFLWCVLAVEMYLGGPSLGGIEGFSGIETEGPSGFYTVVVLFKGLIIYVISRWLAVCSPRIRVDQVTDFCWRVLCPIVLICVMSVLFIRIGYRELISDKNPTPSSSSLPQEGSAH